jgi:hypothetical protein
MTLNYATMLLDEYADGRITGQGRRDDIGLARLVEAVMVLQRHLGR